MNINYMTSYTTTSIMKRSLSFLVIICLLSANALSDEGRKGQAGFQFLRIPMGARQVGMGNTGLASASGASALFWNPAGVADQKNYEMQFTNLNWFGEVT